MHWSRPLMALAVLGLVARVAEARVPSFVRQTGLTCNQCHMSVTPAPDFTFTGMKYRLNGFRTPWVTEKIEAGTEGAVNGNRLVLALGAPLSFHVRSVLLQRAKPTGDPTLPEPSWGTATSEVFNTVAIHMAGPFGDYLGMNNEFYIYGGSSTPGNDGGPGNTHGYIGLNHYQISLGTNASGNMYGMHVAGYSEGSHNFTGVVGLPQPNNQLRFQSGLPGSHSPYFLTYVFAFVGDRVAALVGLEPGENNLDWKRFNYRTQVGVFLKNTDALWMSVDVRVKAGDDFVPGITGMRVLNDGARTIVATDAVQGVSATRANGLPYGHLMSGDMTRVSVAFAGGFTDRGPHSAVWSLGQSIESETYTDNASAKMRSIGFTGKYYYNRTYGVSLNMSKYETWNFTDASGVLHSIPNDLSWELSVYYRMAMNFAWYFTYGENQQYVLDQNWRNGRSWTLNWHYLW